MSNQKRVGYVYDELMTKHKHPFEKHPECPNRIKCIFDKLCELDLVSKMKKIDSRKIKKSELLLAHSEEYINEIRDILSSASPTFMNDELKKFNSIYANGYSLLASKIALFFIK